MPNAVKKIGLSIAVIILGFAVWAYGRYEVPIITYHNIQEQHNDDMLNNVTPKAFERQMRFIKDKGYAVLSFDEYVTALREGRKLAHNSVVIHFDDGYGDNYTNAFPVLKKYGIRAMVFLVSDKIGTPDFLTWAQMKEMEAHEFLAGAHTRTHAYLPDMDYERAFEEIVGSKKTIEAKLGHPIDYFVYPNGGYNPQAQEIIKAAGFKAAATTNRGTRGKKDMYALNRIRVKDSDDGFGLWAKLSGYYDIFRKEKRGY